MRPLNLVMSAFGPYADRVEINMNDLGTSGIYLITGDTGAGKTMIFDAITFALYGEASGNYRQGSMLRSQYSKPEVPTEVELTFSYRNKTYRIRRNPEYERPKLHGNGTTIEKASAELYYPDKRVVTKLQDVNNAVIEIMGIDRDQFTQIAMIAQGDFQKLLVASTKERKEIFQTLFMTKHYEELQDELRSQATEMNNSLKQLEAGINQYYQNISCDPQDPESVRVEKIRHHELPSQEALGVVEKLIVSDETLTEQLQKQEKTLQTQLEKVGVLITKAETRNNNEKSLNQLNELLNQKKPELTELAKKLKMQQDSQSQADKFNQEYAAIQAQLPTYSKLDEASNEVAKQTEQLKTLTKLKEQNQALLQQLTQEITQAQTEVTALQNVATEIEKTQNQKTTTLKQQEELNTLKSAVEQLQKKNKELQQAQQDYVRLSQTASQLKEEFQQQNKLYLDAQAGILASQLQSNQPCPVCGSLTHPHKAQLLDSVPQKSQLDNLHAASQKADKEAETASAASALIKGEVQAKTEAVNRQAETWKFSQQDIVAQIDEKLMALNTEINNQNTKLTKLKADLAKQQKLTTQIPEWEKQRTQTQTKLNETDNNITGAETKKANAIKQRDQYKQDLKFVSQKQAEEQMEVLKQQKDDLVKALNQAQKDYDQCHTEITRLSGNIDSLKKQLEEMPPIDLAEATSQRQTLNEQSSKLSEQQKVVYSRLTINRQTINQIKTESGKLAEIQQKAGCLNVLSDTVNGKLSGKDKITLETYIQMHYFDRIIQRANLRFMVMSNGQYEMVRCVNGLDSRGQSGLDLDVIDHYNGGRRSIKTLSGGESFVASLSLALGLSDEIQASAGGIQLDTMFVDEGFGTLSDDYLQQAMRALSNLATSNRLVGMISHVTELQSQIEKQIVVTKDRLGGSKIKMII